MSFFITYYMNKGLHYKVLCEAHLPTLNLATSERLTRPWRYGYDYCQRCQHEYDVAFLRTMTATRARRVDDEP